LLQGPRRSLKRISHFKYTVITRQERHSIAFFLDQFWGRVVIKVDEVSVVDTKIPHMSLKLKRCFSFTFGTTEQHLMVIEMKRKLAFAGFRPLTYRIFVDGQLVTTLER
jgi:hypothetical protein